MKVIFIYQELSLKTGGGLFTETILNSLKAICPDLLVYSYPPYRNSLKKCTNQLQLYTAGMTSRNERDIMAVIKEKNVDIAVFNGSVTGCIQKKVKQLFPYVKVVSIFHNLEYKFVSDAIKAHKNPLALLTLFSTWVNERNSTKYADVIIALNERDSSDIEAKYQRRADMILPLCIQDRFIPDKIEKSSNFPTGLFVGSNFFANNKGIKWFCENVSDKIKCKIQIIGKGFESESDYFIHFRNIELIGTVDKTDDYYYNADFVISPIFDGSGMKTKTAEALMFGKTIFGTQEAFEGYGLEYEKVGGMCNNAQEFVECINNFVTSECKYNKYSREVYINNFSSKKLEQVLHSIIRL